MTRSIQLISTARALNLGILSGIGTGNVTDQSMSYIVEYQRSLDCPTADPTTQLVYGYRVRLVIQIGSYSAKIGTSLPFLAADGTLNNNSVQMYVETDGVPDASLTQLLAAVSGKDLNVQNYAVFDSLETGFVRFASDTTIPRTVLQLGQLVQSDYPEDVATTFALNQIANGRTCNAAVGALPAGFDAQGATRIRDVYADLGIACDNITKATPLQVAQARAYLGGVEVK